MLASLLLSATVTVAQGRLLTGRDPVAVTAVLFLGATLGALPIAVLTEGAPKVPGSPGPVLAVVALAAAGTLLPFTLFAFGQSRVSAEVAGAFLNLEPLVGAMAGAMVFGDPVGLAQIAGGAAILAGIGLSSLPLLAGRASRRVAVVSDAGAGLGLGAGVGAGPLALTDGEVPALEPAGAAPGGAQGHGCGNVLNRVNTLPQPWNAGARNGRRNRVFVVVYGGKFGAGRTSGARPGPGFAGRRVARPGLTRPGRAAPGRAAPGRRDRSAGPERSRPGGRVAGRPPARGLG